MMGTLVVKALIRSNWFNIRSEIWTGVLSELWFYVLSIRQYSKNIN